MRRSRFWILGGALLGAGLVSNDAWAGDAPKREMPDYSGRAEEPASAGDIALWVPRVLLFPFFAVTNYLIRWPLGVAIAGAERAGIPGYLYDFFFFGPNHKAGIAPLAFVDFGFNPSVGIFAFWDNVAGSGHDLGFHGTAWVGGWLAGAAYDRIHLNGGDTLTLGALGIRRPDHVFYGIGPRSLQHDQSRYGSDQLEASLTYDIHLWRASRLQTRVGIRSVDLYHGHFGGDPSLEARAATGAFAIPSAFNRGYTAEFNHALAALDSRCPRPAPGSGVRVEAEAEHGTDVRHDAGGGWIRYGGTAAGFLDVDGLNRVLSLSLTAQFADPLGNEAIPFTELVSLGGIGPMRGYFPGRLVDRSGTAATVHYRWPIWVWLDGSLQAAVGNVFGEHLDGFKPSLLRFSGAVGIESVGAPDNSLELLVGFGSETFLQGGKVDSLRIAVGTNRGF